MNWYVCPKGISSHRFVLEAKQLKGNVLPQKLFLSFTTAEAWVGTYEEHCGWFGRFGVKGITIDYCDERPPVELVCSDDDDQSELWLHNIAELAGDIPAVFPLLDLKSFGK